MNSRLILPASAAALALFLSPSAGAAIDDLCVEQARGVPGPQPKTPEWWNPAAPGKELRWTGATTRVGSATEATIPDISSLRTVWDAASRQLYLHITVDGDPQINRQQDMLAFGVTDASGAPLVYFDFSPMLGCVAVDHTTSISDITPGCQSGEAMSSPNVTEPVVRYSSAVAGSSWGPPTTVNPTVGTAFEVTVDHPWITVDHDGTNFKWEAKIAITLPVDPGTGQVDPNVRIYGTNFVSFQEIGVLKTLQFPLLCNPGLGGTCTMLHEDPDPVLPDAVEANASEWPAVLTGPTGDCGGIKLMRSLVGADETTTMGVVPGTSPPVPYELPGTTIDATLGSSLWAGFHNNTSSEVTLNSIKAEFRIANWGLTYADWDDATWDLLSFSTEPSLSGTVAAGAYAGGVGQGSIKTEPYIAGSVPANPHQCMHVRLVGNPPDGDSLNFTVDSVYRNMDFVTASVVQRPADVNLIGRPLGPGQTDHPVYLLVRPHNMPSPDICEEMKGDFAGCGPIDIAKNPQQAWTELPRYTVNGFVDSGKTVNLPGAPSTSVLTPFSSYGFYVEHKEDNIQGWEHRLDGAAKIAPYDQLYKLNVGDGQIATVVNTIRVLDPETPSCLSVVAPTIPDGGGGPGGGVVAGDGPGAPVVPAANAVPLGCETPSVRPQCAAGKCAPHDTCTFIEGSKHTHPGGGGSEGPPTTTPGSTCCLNTNESPKEKAGGAGATACMFVMMWGLRRRRKRRKSA